MMAGQRALFEEDELADMPRPAVQAAYDMWNEFAKAHKWAVAQVLDSGRRVALRRAVKDYGGLIGFRANLEKITRSDFVMGRVAPRDGQRPFQATLDWFVRPVTVRKVKEDFYNGAPVPTSHAATNGSAVRSIAWRTELAKYRPGRFWPASWGPRPEDHGPHQIPAEFLEEWRKNNHVSAPVARERETVEQRMSASIASYRKIGQYDRANGVEEKLAAMQGRPPVLVPAPDVAGLGMPKQAPRSAPMPKMSDVVDAGSVITDIPEDPYCEGDDGRVLEP